jgi:nucleotide-binding universal stress UspA family protein
MAIRMVSSMPQHRHRDLGPWEASFEERIVDAMAATLENERSSNDVRPGFGEVAVTSPAGLRRIVVPVDGSPFAERALPVETWIAQALATPIHLVEMVTRPAGTEPAIHYLDSLARRYAAPSWDVAPGDDPAAVIIAATDADPPSVACLATHGRDRSATILGSVAASVLDRTTDPVMLVGPEARPPCADERRWWWQSTESTRRMTQRCSRSLSPGRRHSLPDS